MTNHWAVVPAAGHGRRIGNELPKQYIEVNEMCILDYSIQALLNCNLIKQVIVAIDHSDTHWQTTQSATHPQVQTCIGGEHRFISVRNALDVLSDCAEDDDWIVVHDGVRPCLQTEDLNRLLQAIKDEPTGGIAVMPVSDTIKQLDGEYVQQTLHREQLVRAATPQVFRYSLLCEAYQHAHQQDLLPSDEAAAVEQIAKPVKTVLFRSSNIKLTYPEDVLCIEALLKQENSYRLGN